MFEISQLKAKKLPELQDLAKKLSVPKYRSLKKLDLVYQILDYQAANPEEVKQTIGATDKTKSNGQETQSKSNTQNTKKKSDESNKDSDRDSETIQTA